jgi:hypothetical protein
VGNTWVEQRGTDCRWEGMSWVKSVACMGERSYLCGVCWERKKHLGVLGLDVSIVLKRIFKSYFVKMWAIFIMAKNIIHWRTHLNMDVGFILYLRDQ